MMRRAVRWLERFARDRRGTTAVVMGLALIPLLALVGSGLDIARAYTVQGRLQQACDAAALAGRRAMLADSIDAKVTSETTKFLNFNFAPGLYGTTPITPEITRPSAGTVQVATNTTVPTALMQVFGYRQIPVKVTCQASQTFLNIDIVMVLDNTGSMNETITGGSTKIQALRDAVMEFYKQLKPVQDELAANGYRLRYSIVPFAQAVNVGKLLYAKDPTYIRTSAPYFRTTYVSPRKSNGDYDVTWEIRTVNHDSGWLTSSSWNGCVEERGTIVTTGAAPSATELTSMKDLNIDLLPTSSDPSSQWLPADAATALTSAGLAPCPVEAKRLKSWTQAEMQAYVNGLTPNGGTYLDLGMMWGGRMISSAGVFADSPFSYNGMRTFKYMIYLTDGDMDPAPPSYTGYGVEVAQHRIRNETTSNPIINYYTTGNSQDVDDLKKRHEARFDRLCQSVRNLDVSIWTIKISNSPMDNHLKDCATGEQSATISNRQALIDKFAEIGQAITELKVAK